jgi:hypothetical protein
MVTGLAARADEAPERLRAGVSVGAGTAYDMAGARVELGSNHLAAYAGFGLGAYLPRSTLTSSGWGFSAGARWYSGVRSDWFISANFTDAWHSDDYSFDDLTSPNPRRFPGSVATLTATFGYVWAIGRGVRVEAGAGAGIARSRDASSTSGASPPPPGPPPAAQIFPIPDVSLGLGYVF